MTHIVIQACWPFSGQKYEVWKNGEIVLSTNDLVEAKAVK